MEAPPSSSSLPPQFIKNKHALDKFFATQFKYKIASTPQTTTIIGALKLLRENPFRFNFIDVIQTYNELLRRALHIDEKLLHDLKNLIAEFKDLLEPWVEAQGIVGDEKERKRRLPDRLATVLREKCENKLNIITASENPSQNFMHEMTQKLCIFFNERIQRLRNPNDIHEEVSLGSTLYFMLRHYDQLLLPILEKLRDENETSEGKEMIKVFDPRKYAYIKGGRRTRHKRSSKRSGKRSSKRSGKRSDKKRSGKRSGKR